MVTPWDAEVPFVNAVGGVGAGVSGADLANTTGGTGSEAYVGMGAAYGAARGQPIFADSY